jgi:hypothetical protein
MCSSTDDTGVTYETKDALARRPYADLSVTAYLAATGRLRK